MPPYPHVLALNPLPNHQAHLAALQAKSYGPPGNPTNGEGAGGR
jgi:hypothetical protein